MLPLVRAGMNFILHVLDSITSASNGEDVRTTVMATIVRCISFKSGIDMCQAASKGRPKGKALADGAT